MKYLYDEIIDLSVEDDDEYRKRETRFRRQCMAYWKEFNKNKSKLSADVIEVIKHTHDASILSLEPIHSEKRIDIAMHLELEGPYVGNSRKGTLMHYDIKKFNFDIIEDLGRHSLWYKVPSLGYIYGELLVEGEYWTHNIIFHPAPSEMFIKCKSLEWIGKKEDNLPESAAMA